MKDDKLWRSKLANIQLNKLKSAAKIKTMATFRIGKEKRSQWRIASWIISNIWAKNQNKISWCAVW